MDQSWYLKKTTPNRLTDGAIGNLEVLGCENFGLSLLSNKDSRMKQANWQSLRATHYTFGCNDPSLMCLQSEKIWFIPLRPSGTMK